MREGLLVSNRSRWHSGSDMAPAVATPPRWFDHKLADLLQHQLSAARLRVELWDGASHWPDEQPPTADVVVHDRPTLLRLIGYPDLHFGDAFMAGRAEIRGDLVRALTAIDRTYDPDRLSIPEWFALHFPRANDIFASRQNVHHHYDLGNDFYALWLDRHLLYTCAYFPDPEMSLEDAQVAKMDLVCRKVRLSPGDEVLEAGCGWGGLALHMARHYGARVKAFNLSHEQIAYARSRAQAEGLSDRVQFIEDDYRNATGRFDVFMSVGMLEHVGQRHYRSLGDVIRRTLKPETGRGLLHFIGRDHPRPLNVWIRRRIFPGAHPPALSELQEPVFENAGVSVLDIENLRLHYAVTLRHWLKRFDAAQATVRGEFGDAFVRAWRLYLAGSQAAFLTGALQLFQIVFAPSRRVPHYWSRDDATGASADRHACCTATS